MDDLPMYKRGLSVYKPHPKAPEFVKADMVIDGEAFKEFIDANMDGTGKIRLQIKESRKGDYYAQKNEYKPKAASSNDGVDWSKDGLTPDDTPF